MPNAQPNVQALRPLEATPITETIAGTIAETIVESIAAPIAEWPEHPYRGLNFYTAIDRPLFAERDQEIQDCAQLLASFETRVLLLHGRSGAGKSSFLRAGLIPCLKEQDLFHIPTDSSGIPLIIRCTHEPLAKIRNQLLLAMSTGNLRQASREMPAALIEALMIGEAAQERAIESLLEALQYLCAHLREPLLLVIDQAEEILTLNEHENSSRCAFFLFLEEVCFRRLDLSIIVSLRTEYFGQFCDSIRIVPATPRAVNGGIDMFLLKGIQSPSSIKAAIVRPTETTVVPGYGIPYERYKFSYADGLADTIAADLLEQCGESNILPTLQIVCKDLYDEIIIRRKRSTITEQDYQELGYIRGRVDAYIDGAIRDVLSSHGAAAGQEDIEAWRGVLSSLVARSEGGAVVTLLASEADLEARGRKASPGSDVVKILAGMADEQWRLLRLSKTYDCGAQMDRREYSLGHDALAVALHQWADSYEKIKEQRLRLEEQRRLEDEAREAEDRARQAEDEARRKRDRTFFRLSIAAGIAVCIGIVGLFWEALERRRDLAVRLQDFATKDPTSEFRLRTILLAVALKAAEGPFGLRVPQNDILDRLRDILARSPQYGGSFDAIGANADGSKLVVVKGSEVSVWDESKGFAASKVGEIPAGRANPWGTVAGFIGDRPIVMQAGKLFHWTDGTRKIIDVQGYVPNSLKDQNYFPDIAGDAIRLQFMNIGASLTRMVVLRAVPRKSDLELDTDDTFRSISWEGSRYAPTFSETSNRYALLKATNTAAPSLIFGSLTGSSVREADIDAKQDDGVSEPAGTSFVHSLAFNQVASAVAVRSLTDIAVVPVEPPDARRLALAVPVELQKFWRGAWPISRPVMAMRRDVGSIQFAWMDEAGIVTSSAKVDDTTQAAVLGSARHLYSGTDNALRISFGPDGKHLILQHKNPQGEAILRIWNLTDARRLQLEKMSIADLQKEVCTIASIQGATFLKEEERALTFLGDDQSKPCS